MKFTAFAAAVALALSGALIAGCDRDPASSGGTSATGSSSPSGAGGTADKSPSGATQPGAPKRPASPTGPGGSK